MKTFLLSLLLTSLILLMATRYTANYVLHGENLNKRQYSGSSRPTISITPTGYEPVVTKTITLPATTITPATPGNGVKYTTYLTTIFSVEPAYTEYVTTTDQNGNGIVYSTYVPPTTIAVIQDVESPIPADAKDSADPYSGSSHVWGMGMSMIIVVFTAFVFLA